MANPYTADALLLPALKRRGMLPNTPETLADADYYALADDEIQSYIVPLLLKAREEHLIQTYEFTCVSGTDTYPLPYRAAGGKLRDVWISSANNSGFKQMQRIEPERVGDYSSSGAPGGYRFEGNNLIVMPTPGSAAATIRIKYHAMPNRLVAVSACAVVASYVSATKTITTVGTVPATFGATVPLDIVRGKPGFDSLAQDNTAVSAATTTIVLTDAISPLVTGGTVSTGDYVCLAGESPIPQIPRSLHPLLAQRVVYRALEALGDPRAAGALASCQELERLSLTLLSPRSDGAGRAVVNRYGPGFRHNWRFR
jgi:hypothetical protein